MAHVAPGNGLSQLVEAFEQEGADHTNGARTLTPVEYERLRQLEDGLATLRSALAVLDEPADETTVTLRDGRFEGGNTDLAVELRIDEGVCGVISADLFRIGPSGRTYVASLRTAPGVRIALRDGAWTVVGQDEAGSRARGRLKLNGQSGNPDSLVGSLTLESALTGLPSRAEIAFLANRSPGMLRNVGIEVEIEENVDRPRSYRFDGRDVTIESALADAGVETFLAGTSTRIPANRNGWDSTQLHALMQDVSQASLLRRAWELHLLVLSRSDQQGLLGVMFDTTDTLPRQGAAVFAEEIRSIQGIEHDRKVIQTAVHELGHALNLAHRFERMVGRADSVSFMNYDWRYRGGNRRDEFWSKFRFTFDPDELEFLRHAPLPPVIPGGSPFHSINYWADGNGGYSPYVPEVPLPGFKLSLKPPLGGPIFDFAQPVFLEVELTNQTGQTQEIPSFLLDPKAGFLELLIHRRTGDAGGGLNDANSFVPVVQRCFDFRAADDATVPNNGSIKSNLNLTYGSGGFAFAEPGTYEVTAVLAIFDRRDKVDLIVKSDPLRIRVSTPKTREEEHDGLDFFRDDIGLYLALGGSDALPKAEETLKEIVERRRNRSLTEDDPLVANVTRSLAINAQRSYIRYQDGKYSEREPRLETAASLLESLTKEALKAFDASTVAGIGRLITRIAEASNT